MADEYWRYAAQQRAAKKSKVNRVRTGPPRTPRVAKIQAAKAFDKDSYGTPSDWNQLRHKVFARDNWTCRKCNKYHEHGERSGLDCHHVVPISKGGRNTEWNLITLCHGCHRKQHKHLQKKASSKHQHSHATKPKVVKQKNRRSYFANR